MRITEKLCLFGVNCSNNNRLSFEGAVYQQG